MSAVIKTIVATGASSGLGFEAMKQLLEQTQPYRIILGARNTETTQAAYDSLKFDAARHAVTVLPLELSDLKSTRSFAQQTLGKLGTEKLDYLFLNAGITNGTEAPGSHGSKWCEAYIVNHLSQHYIVHLLREKVVSSKSHIVFVSSGAVRNPKDTSVLEEQLKDGSGQTGFTTYGQTKLVQLMNAHWWRRNLAGQATVVAVSPGMIPSTGIGRGNGMTLPTDHPDAKSVPEGAQNLLRAFTKNDFPEDPEQIFLTSWGEWWPKSVYELSLDKALQEKFSPSKEEIEEEEGL